MNILNSQSDEKGIPKCIEVLYKIFYYLKLKFTFVFCFGKRTCLTDIIRRKLISINARIPGSRQHCLLMLLVVTTF